MSGCPPDAPIEIWDALAKESGFETAPDDYFDFADFACTYDIVTPPSTVAALAEITPVIVRGRIVDVVPITRLPFHGSAQYYVYVRVQIEQTLKGEYEGESILINEVCAHGAKVAGLKRAMPGDDFIFFVDGPYERESTPAFYSLEFYGLGMVGERADGGLRFERAWPFDTARPSLAEFNSLDELAAALEHRTD